jgi:hypothetical protein
MLSDLDLKPPLPKHGLGAGGQQRKTLDGMRSVV